MNPYEKYDIIIPNNRTTGQAYTICPKCSNDRKKKTVKCLGVNLDKKIWHCNHCGYKGHLKDIQKKIYAKPPQPVHTNNTPLSDKTLKWFNHRGISQQTLLEMRISEGMSFMPQTAREENTIQFNYFKEDEICNIKYRTEFKEFKLFKDAELIFYNLDCVKNYENIYIVEGEIDALSLIESGIMNVVSVPNGANKSSNNLQYIENCLDYFDNVKEIYLATDSDIAGRNLQEDLALRFGKDKCFKIDFKDCKDANEFLIKYGKIELIEVLSNKIPFPIEGVFTISDISDEIDDMYINGLEKGLRIGIDSHDKCCSFVKGYITTITGIPSHGKSEYLDFILLRLNLIHQWKGAFYSPENRPLKLHFSKMAEKLIGKKWDGQYRITSEEKDDVKNYLNEKVWFIKPANDFTLATILESVLQLIKRYGIDYFVIDAWNKLDHKYIESETKYIGESLDLLSNFCDSNKVHCFLVAHPTKIKKDKHTGVYEIPTLYDIAGSANFFNKTDIGICIYRNFDLKETTVYFQKLKFKHWGDADPGYARFKYDLTSGRYYDESDGLNTSNWLKHKPQLSFITLKEIFEL